MKIIIAPNAFKGSLTASRAAVSLAEGLLESNLSCEVTTFPIADGGDGTAMLIAEKLGCRSLQKTVNGPLGKKVEANFSWQEETKTAIIEMSEASGLRLLKQEELDPVKANTRGTGELMIEALEMGAREMVLGIGGSATVDGGSGLLAALGVRFLDKNSREIEDLPEGLTALEKVDISGLDSRLGSCRITVLCDVKNKLLGDKGAAAVFGPQKGAGQEQVLFLEKILGRLNEVAIRDLQVDMSLQVSGGAAGGVAAGLAAFLQADIVSGIDYFLDIMEFDKALEKGDLVITAEGSLDAQTLEGKGPAGVARRAGERNIPVIVIAGSIPLTISKEMHQYFTAVFSLGHGVVPLKEALQNTAADLRRTACQIGNVLALRKN